MLVLTRKQDQAIYVGNNVRIVVVEMRRDGVRIGIDAPRDLPVHRSEVYHAKVRDGEIVPPAATEGGAA